MGRSKKKLEFFYRVSFSYLRLFSLRATGDKIQAGERRGAVAHCIIGRLRGTYTNLKAEPGITKFGALPLALSRRIFFEVLLILFYYYNKWTEILHRITEIKELLKNIFARIFFNSSLVIFLISFQNYF